LPQIKLIGTRWKLHRAFLGLVLGPQEDIFGQQRQKLSWECSELTTPRPPPSPPKKENNIVSWLLLKHNRCRQWMPPAYLAGGGWILCTFRTNLVGLLVRMDKHYLPEDRPFFLLVFFPLISPSFGKFACLILQHQIPLEKNNE